MPFHFLGGGPKPASLKLSDSGQIAESITPTMISISSLLLFTVSENLRKFLRSGPNQQHHYNCPTLAKFQCQSPTPSYDDILIPFIQGCFSSLFLETHAYGSSMTLLFGSYPF
ncbi:hypothetical protein M0R45_006189 [Rubus argutus]|uniref:Cytochrome c biogenesis B n=1 Tax=Rubus argutus TaxID=59490 RepID=A0AAW1YQ33_RUBAR